MGFVINLCLWRFQTPWKANQRERGWFYYWHLPTCMRLRICSLVPVFYKTTLNLLLALWIIRLWPSWLTVHSLPQTSKEFRFCCILDAQIQASTTSPEEGSCNCGKKVIIMKKYDEIMCSLVIYELCCNRIKTEIVIWFEFLTEYSNNFENLNNEKIRSFFRIISIIFI